MSMERVLNNLGDKKALNNLKAAAAIWNTTTTEIEYVVRDCYLDYGTNWMWTTIIAVTDEKDSILGSYQAITPREWKEITGAQDTAELIEVALKIIDSKRK